MSLIKKKLFQADQKTIRIINKAIFNGEIKNKEGRLIKDPIKNGLIREDKKIFYPIKDSIPIMLISEGILIAKLCI